MTATDYINSANTFLAQGLYRKAHKYYKTALKLEPQNPLAWNNLGSTLLAQGQIPAAQAAYQKAHQIQPRYADPVYSLGVIAKTQGQLDLATNYFRQALAYHPHHSKAHLGLGRILMELGRYPPAQKHYQAALNLHPHNARAWGDLGAIYVFQEKIPSAIKALKKAISLNPHLPSLHFNLGMAFKQQHKFKHAIANFQRAFKLDPHFRPAIQSLYFVKREICNWSNIADLETALDSNGFDNHFTSILRTDDPALNLQVAKLQSQRLENPPPKKSFTFSHLKKAPEARIRLGYLSHDFRNHPVGQIVTPIFAHHNPKEFAVFVFSSGENDNSPWRKHAENVEHFIDTSRLNHIETAQLIHRHQVDILIDTTGPMSINPMLTPAFRPAPIQVSWMGILGTSGAKFYDYVIGDPIVTPPNHSQFFTEKIIRLPCFSWISPTNIKPKFTRADFGLPEDHVVFASFSLPMKIDQALWDIWMRILSRVPRSVLWLWRRNVDVATNLKRSARRAGISPRRLIFFDKLPYDDHLARIPLADLVLDTQIYQGAQTSTSVLSTGTPLLTVLGRHFISRVTASLLTQLNIPDLIAIDLQDYGKKAINLTQHPENLIQIRKKLMTSLQKNAYPPQKFVTDLELAYHAIWQRHRSGRSSSIIQIRS